MTTARTAVGETAQCATCGGDLVPAGDDWQHGDPRTGCTRFGLPVLCRHCPVPALTGAQVCADHSGLPHTQEM